MKKYHSKNKWQAQRAQARNQRMRMILRIVLVSIFLGGGIILVVTSQSVRSGLVGGFTQFKQWALDRKSHLHEKVVQVKKIAQQADAEPQIHFEFYTALPSMRVTHEPPLKSSEPPSPSEPKQVAAAKPAPIFNAEDIERQFSAEINNNK